MSYIARIDFYCYVPQQKTVRVKAGDSFYFEYYFSDSTRRKYFL